MSHLSDPYFKKAISLAFHGQKLNFHVSQNLFSSHQIDDGSKLLLRTLAENVDRPIDRLLDLGCGYGTLGLTLKALHKNSIVHMVDRDALAVDYSKQNAILNGYPDIQIYGSLGYADLTGKNFDLIVSNIPAKAGEKVISYFLEEGRFFLTPKGLMAVVVVAPLEAFVKSVLEAHKAIQIVFQKSTSSYAIFHYTFLEGLREILPEKTALERGIYQRHGKTFAHKNIDYKISAAQGLPEFDTLDFQTELLFDYLLGIRTMHSKRIIVSNPGQGHIPIFLAKIFSKTHLMLVDRDLLSLRYSLLNLVQNQYPAEKVTLQHQVNLPIEEANSCDLAIVKLRDQESKVALDLMLIQFAAQLSHHKTALIVGDSTPITRLTETIALARIFEIKERRRNKGASLLVLKKN